MAQATGLKIGLVDADVYGPSIPTMMNLVGEQEPAVNEGMRKALHRHLGPDLPTA